MYPFQMYCECFSAGVTCSKSCKCTGCENIPGNKALASTLARKRKKIANLSSSVPSLVASGVAQGKSGATSKGPATAASATTAASAPKPPTATKPSPRARPALLQGGRPIHGIAFFPADLRGVPSSLQQKKKPAEAPKPSRLHHNLMLAPSALLTGSDGTASSRTAVKGLMMTAFANTKGSGLFGSRPSELEEAWDKETTKVTTFFAQMRRQLDAKSQGSSRTRDQHHQAQHAFSVYGTSASNPAILLKALQEDVKALHNVAQTAQIEAHVSLRDESRRDARWWQGKRAAVVAKLDGKDRKRAGDELWCDEDFDEAVETAPKVSTGEETMNVQRLRDLVVRAAVDTALLRETARIVRSKARELARKRMKTSVETKR
jgi:Tesmin/TSO1-like CXC domain, cysteine-rich domain